MTIDTESSHDVIVVGGGPGGSTAATFMARRGHRVLLLEKHRMPRYQIGESLLPATVNGICTMLGVREELEKAGFQKKFGGAFRWGRDPEPWAFNFRGPVDAATPTHAFQVERSKFDLILLRNAQRQGVDVREECAVHETLVEGGRVAGVRFTDERGRACVARARFVVDASGNTSTLGRQVGERVYSEFFKNYAVFGYFENGKRLPAPREGHILSAAFDDGWFWYIPLSPTLTSVGAVFQAPENARRPIEGTLEETLQRYIARCPVIADFLSGATRVTEGEYGKVRLRKDWSYTTDRLWGDGLVLVGDAACFVDPLLSQGVHLATYSGLLAARSINSVLAGEIDEAPAFEEFEARYRREYGLFYQYLTSLYDMNCDQQSFFWRARSLLATEERGNDAFVRLLAGEAAADPAVSSAQRFFDARLGTGSQLEGVMNPGYAACAFEPSMAFAIPKPATTPPRGDIRALFPELDREGMALQLAARGNGTAQAESPMRQGGLVTTADGLGWTMAPANRGVAAPFAATQPSPCATQ